MTAVNSIFVKGITLPGRGKRMGGLAEKRAGLLKNLTAREREIMRLVSQGLSNKHISRQLRITEGTIKVHLHNIYQKLAIVNRTMLAALAQYEDRKI